MNTSPQALAPLVDAIVASRRTQTQATFTPSLLPPDAATAYATQRAVTAAIGADIGGWKVGMLDDGTPTAAPIYARDIRTDGARWTLPAHGVLVVEIELALRLASDLTPRPGAPYTQRELASAVGEVLVGIEVLQSRFAGDTFPPLAVHLADNLGNLGYVTGGATRAFATLDLARLACRYSQDGAVRHDRVGGHPQDDPWKPVLACLNAGGAVVPGFRSGQFITTGTLVPPLRVGAPTEMAATLEGVGRVAMAFVR